MDSNDTLEESTTWTFKSVEITLPNGKTLWTVLENPEARLHGVNCDLCGQRITLTEYGNPARLFAHRTTKGCRNEQKRRSRREVHKQVGTDPCGWCGLDGCYTQLTVKGSTRTVASSCRYHYASMSYSQAAKCSNASPCTNVPIHCPFCPRSAAGLPRTIWKYNAMQHLILEHMEHGEGEDGDHLPPIPPELMVAMHVSRREEKKLNIDEEMTERWRDLYGVPGSDAVEGMEKELAEESNKKRDPPKRRERAPSAAILERRSKSQRKG